QNNGPPAIVRFRREADVDGAALTGTRWRPRTCRGRARWPSLIRTRTYEAAFDRMSALGANRTHRHGWNVVNDPKRIRSDCGALGGGLGQSLAVASGVCSRQ